MKQKLIDSIRRRLRIEITDRSTMRALRGVEVTKYVDSLIAAVYLYAVDAKDGRGRPAYMVEVAVAAGRAVAQYMPGERIASALLARIGGFMLYSFEETGLIRVRLGRGSHGHATYTVDITDYFAFRQLWSKVDLVSTEKLPSTHPHPDWESGRMPKTNVKLVKTNYKPVLDNLNPEMQPMVFECVNRAQKVGWRVDRFVYDTQKWALRTKSPVFDDVWNARSPQAKATKLRETHEVSDIARRMLGKTFYHLYYLDFRARKYPATAYLHEQGGDLARGLLRRSDAKPIGEQGFFWLMVHLANKWAGNCGRPDELKTDKLPLKERYQWALANEETMIEYGADPRQFRGWMEADKPWQFLAACRELHNLRIWQYESGAGFDNYDYPSSQEAYIDGTINGLQHLAALTKDEEVAIHVNLLPSDLPGDLYGYVAKRVWEHIDRTLEVLTQEEIAECNLFIEKMRRLRGRAISLPERDENRRAIFKEMQKERDNNRDLLEICAPVFWSKIKDLRERRKIVKRNVLSLPYGGTPYGLGTQQIKDATKHGIPLLSSMEHLWGAFMGRLVYDTARRFLRKAMLLLDTLEAAGKEADAKGRFLGWLVPVTHFPVVQYYVQGKVKKVWVQYGPPRGPKISTGYYSNTLQLAVSDENDPVPSSGKQAAGASPNIIHSLDAAHLMITVYRCPFPVTTVHDSFGCLLADMPLLYRTVRGAFADFYHFDPLSAVLEDIGADKSLLEFGNLDIDRILESEYCFS
jgi:DNA-directed RNA polymerase